MSQDSAGSRKSSKICGQISQQFTLREQKAIARYLFLQDLDTSEIHRLMSAAVGEAAPSYKEVKDWIQGYLDGSEQPDLCICGGKATSKNGPVAESATDPALVARIEVLIVADKHISMEQLASMAMASVHSVDMIITNILGLSRVCERWVPRFRTPDQREYRMALCRDLLRLYQSEGSDMLSRIIVGDEAFVLYHAQEKTVGQQKKAENNPGDKFKPPNEPQKVYCIFFYDNKGMLYANEFPGNKPPTQEEYCSILKDELIPAIRRKRGTDSSLEELYLFTEHTPAHDAQITQDTMKELKLVRFPHSPASPDLEPHEYWLFRALKRVLDSCKLQKRADVWSAVNRQLHSFSELEYNNSIMKLPNRWNLCLEKDGLYVL